MEVLNYYFRKSDGTSYILYKGNDGRENLTNGICIWSKSVKEKIATLKANHEDVDLNRILKNLKEHHPYASITEYLETL